MMLRRSVICVCKCSGRIISARNIQVTRNTSACFKSQYSIDKIYPNSNQDYLSTRKSPLQSPASKEGEKETFSGHIPIKKLDIKYVQGSGPGGQNVNKVNTKVEIRFHVASADWIPEDVRERLAVQSEGRINKNGYLIVTSDTTRKQMLNQADCMNKIREMIFTAAIEKPVPTQEEIDIKNKRMARAKRGILRVKKYHSLTKQSRQAPV